MATRKTRAAAAVAPVAEAAAAPAVPAAAATAAVADAGTKRKAETLDQEEEEEPTFAPTAGVFGLCVCGRMRERVIFIMSSPQDPNATHAGHVPVAAIPSSLVDVACARLEASAIDWRIPKFFSSSIITAPHRLYLSFARNKEALLPPPPWVRAGGPCRDVGFSSVVLVSCASPMADVEHAVACIGTCACCTLCLSPHHAPPHSLSVKHVLSTHTNLFPSHHHRQLILDVACGSVCLPARTYRGGGGYSVTCQC
jgi:hypothetical protein